MQRVFQVKLLNWIHLAFHVDNGTAPEILLELLHFERCGHQDELQLPVLLEQQPEDSEEEVGLQRALMDLVQDDVREVGRTRTLSTTIVDPLQKKAGSDEEDLVRGLGWLAVHAHLVATRQSHLLAPLPSHPGGRADGANPPRLRDGDAHGLAVLATEVVQDKLWDLRRLPRARGASYHHHLVRTHEVHDLLLVLSHREATPSRLQEADRVRGPPAAAVHRGTRPVAVDIRGPPCVATISEIPPKSRLLG
mmetsp:Transcript_32591/g.71097  ORF Transcript_32591/g.71097 Transcript_32591/m.71097 type:complete len:250 (+) Transcript_32591:886-1635(+)